GAHLLDPSSRPVLQAKYNGAPEAATYANWPHSWNATSVNKVIILMTDGVNTNQQRVLDSVYDSLGADYFNNPENQEEIQYSSQLTNPSQDWIYEYINNSDDDLTTSDGLDTNNDGVLDHCGNRLNQDFYFRYRNRNYRADVACGRADFQLMEICSQLKAYPQNATIYTIGFELDRGSSDSWTWSNIVEAYEAYQAETVLMNCASSLSEHYNVDGVDIENAFKSIGNELRELKLVN
ncbi:MAG: hypothetical protein AAF968_19280, partial [Pseudomonadota bacterium]